MPAHGRWSVRGLFAAAALASSAGASEPAPDCAKYSLEGIYVDMTLAAAQAAVPGHEWREGRVRTRRDGKPLDMWVSSAGGVVEWVLINYTPMTFKRNMSAGLGNHDQRDLERYGALEQDFRARFGTPTWKGVAATLASRTIWIDEACDRVVVLDWGHDLWGRRLAARLERASTWRSSLEARVARDWPPFAVPAAERRALADSVAQPDCSSYALEGIWLSMTVAEAQAATPDVEWRPIMLDEATQTYRLLSEKKLKNLGNPGTTMQHHVGWRAKTQSSPPIALALMLVGGAVEEVSVEYAPFTALSIFRPAKARGRARAKLPELEQDFTERFGPPASARVVTLDEHARTTWINTACDLMLILDAGLRGAASTPDAFVTAVLGRASRWPPASDGDPAKATP